MSMPDATQQPTNPQHSNYEELHAFLTNPDDSCSHETYRQLEQDLPFILEGIQDSSDARELLNDAYDDGEIDVRDDAEFGKPGTQIHKANCAVLNSESGGNEQDDASVDADNHRDDGDDTVVKEPPEAEKDDYTRELEDRVDNLEDTVETLVDTVESQQLQLEQVTHGLTELQANQLARGNLISTQGADLDRLNSLDGDSIDLDVSVVGDRDVVRADNTTIGDSGSAVNDLPDFDSLIPLEAERQKLRWELKSRDDFDTVTKRRAVDVWQDIHVLNSNNRDRVIIEHDDLREKVSSILDREGNPQTGDTLSETTRRVRRKLAELSDDVLHLDKGTNPHRLVGRLEDVQDARLEDGTVSRNEDGDAMVLNGGR